MRCRGEPVRPVDSRTVEATLAHLPRVVADMVRLQLLTALLAGLLVFELVHMIAPVLQRRF